MKSVLFTFFIANFFMVTTGFAGEKRTPKVPRQCLSKLSFAADEWVNLALKKPQGFYKFSKYRELVAAAYLNHKIFWIERKGDGALAFGDPYEITFYAAHQWRLKEARVIGTKTLKYIGSFPTLVVYSGEDGGVLVQSPGVFYDFVNKNLEVVSPRNGYTVRGLDGWYVGRDLPDGLEMVLYRRGEVLQQRRYGIVGASVADLRSASILPYLNFGVFAEEARIIGIEYDDNGKVVKTVPLDLPNQDIRYVFADSSTHYSLIVVRQDGIFHHASGNK